jgi:hypothetical protein
MSGKQTLSRLVLTCITLLDASGYCGCGGSGIPAQTASDEAHNIAVATVATFGDVATICPADAGASGACRTVNGDLCSIMAKATELDGLAIDAGYKPTVPVSSLASSVPCH